MIASPARTLANQANAKKSTGPRTPEGKAISRANSFKHGMTGAGVVLPHEDLEEINRRFHGLRDQFRPGTPMGEIMVHRVAFLSVRLERCAEREAGYLGEKIRHAGADHDEKRFVEVAGLLETIHESPAATVRRLMRTPEGIEALINEWLGLRSDLERTNARFWTAAHSERAHLLSGRRMDDVPVSRIKELSEAIWGDFGLLRDDEGAGLKPKERQAWAKQRLIEYVDEEVGALRQCYEGLDHEAFELDRQDAGKRALFDTSRDATLARRYEADAERGMFRALKELRQVEKDAVENPPSPRSYPVVPLASSGTPEAAPPEPDDETTVEAEDGPAEGPDRRPTSFARPVRVEIREEVGVLGGGEVGIPRRTSVN